MRFYAEMNHFEAHQNGECVLIDILDKASLRYEPDVPAFKVRVFNTSDLPFLIRVNPGVNENK